MPNPLNILHKKFNIMHIKDRLKMIEDNIKRWQKQMQNPELSTYVEFVRYAKIVTKLNKERTYLRNLLSYEEEEEDE